MSTGADVPVKTLFELFPGKPARRSRTSPACLAARLRVSPEGGAMSTTEIHEPVTDTEPIVPSFDDATSRPQARHHLLQGQPGHGLPGPDLRNAAR